MHSDKKGNEAPSPQGAHMIITPDNNKSFDPGARLDEMRRERITAKVEAELAHDVKKSMALPKVEDLEARAREILERGDPVTFILDEFNKIHVGDRDLAGLLLASVGAQLCRNSEGIHVGLFGDSGTGKSDAGKAMYHLLSPDFKCTGTMSDKAVFYHPFPEKTLYFLDETTLLTDEQEAIIREAISNYPIGSFRRTVKDQKPFLLEIKPRLSFWFTRQDTTLTRQMSNRLITLNPDSTPEHQDNVHTASVRRGINGTVRFDTTPEVMVCREMDLILKTANLVTVAIPFLSRVQWNGSKSDYRAHEQFHDLIRAFTAIFQFQRERDPEGNLIATREDYNRANAVMTKVRDIFLLKTDNRGLKILQTIAEHGELDNINNERYLEFSQISRLLNWNRGKVHRIIYGGGNDENADRGLCSLNFFRVEKGFKTIEDQAGMKRTVHYSTAFLDINWNQLYEFASIAYLPPDEPV